ncbi:MULTISPECIES: hypothetical protein [Acidobacterium]|uniref:Uncharacterized protein n=1 Tax=Acidobacterium capsulatum (strain ATCC 51196 / DSM 11244 / BCRC 80197 / JCM 7670 / NBRC 15755 / NCIMB 13165 / 161) TaxID=240015 RepID=C1F159_ACIC5|nr:MULTISPECIES: hypothetical protein [Acidobacterium]ACO31841.1 hypothetical protein ACP_0563 [Acidobacterium capsulatum ATCC 51196]HCT61909.1 hypothetical protein [Acidobacterium sp.]
MQEQDGMRLPVDRRTFLKAASLMTAASMLPEGWKSLGETRSGEQTIAIPAKSHAAVRTAAGMLAESLGLPVSAIRTYEGAAPERGSEIVLALKETSGVPAALSEPIERDGYAVLSKGSTRVVCGARPRSLLFAAGEPHRWLGREAGVWVRNPDFALRCAGWHPKYSGAQLAAMLGANTFFAPLHASVSLKDEMPEVFARLSPEDQQRLEGGVAAAMERNAAIVKEYHDADLTVFAELPYGNNFERWSPALYRALLEVYPTAKGVRAPHSWEKAALCPSDAATWKAFDAYVRECARQAQADGMAATFWDQYGMYCQDDRCQKDGLNHFKNEVYESVSHYYAVLKPMGMKLHLRTWSSGCPHWFGDQYVHAPGYGQFSESHYEVWSRVAKETPGEIMMQTKVYHSDCEPNPPFSTMLGKCSPHTEIVEYQDVGQTIGRQYFPASVVNYMQWTMKKALSLVGHNGGAEIGAGGTMQTNYDVYADILNSCKAYAWRELSWDVNASVPDIWARWSQQIYSPGAAPHMARAMQLSEDAVYKTFSPLGFGSSTNSDFAGTIERRETLLRYTNRNYLPEYTPYLEPTKENIDRIVAEKKQALADIDEMFAALEQAKPHLTAAQRQEIETRFDWLREFAICNVTLDISLWRFRYLRAQAQMLTTDPDQLRPLAEAWDLVAKHAPNLFRYQPSQKFACYDVPLGELQRPPALGSPLPLMRELYQQSLWYMEGSVGPNYLPKELIRTITV